MVSADITNIWSQFNNVFVEYALMENLTFQYLVFPQILNSHQLRSTESLCALKVISWDK